MSKNGFNQSKSNDIEDDKRKHQFNDATEHITTTETGDTSHSYNTLMKHHMVSIKEMMHMMLLIRTL